MKRSDMVNKMMDFWLAIAPSERVEYAQADPGFIAALTESMDKLLGFLETQGMKPPVEELDPVLFKTTHIWKKEVGAPDLSGDIRSLVPGTGKTMDELRGRNDD